jgi:sugar phosphate isomerase/epimerase
MPVETTTLPVVGVAMPSFRVAEYCGWIVESQRDLEIQDAAFVEMLDTDWHGGVRELRAMLHGYTGRLGIHGPFIGMTLANFDPKIRAVVIDRLKQALDYCAELGGSHIVLHSPLEFLGTPFHPFEERSLIDFRQIIHATLDPVVEYATERQITIVIETIFDRDPALLARLVREFDSEHVRMSVDTGHAYINYKLGAPPVDYFIREAGTLLGHVHLQDTDGYADRHWLPGEGEMKWRAVFDAIQQTGANPRLIIEIADHSRIVEAATWFADHGLAR